MQSHNISQNNNNFVFVDPIKEESFDLSDMITQEENLEENTINDDFDFFVKISYNEHNTKRKRKSKKNIIKRAKKRLKKHFNKYFKRKKLRKKNGSSSEH